MKTIPIQQHKKWCNTFRQKMLKNYWPNSLPKIWSNIFSSPKSPLCVYTLHTHITHTGRKCRKELKNISENCLNLAWSKCGFWIKYLSDILIKTFSESIVTSDKNGTFTIIFRNRYKGYDPRKTCVTIKTEIIPREVNTLCLMRCSSSHLSHGKM